MNVRAYESEYGGWVVADDGGWLPGVYATERAAHAAGALAQLSFDALDRLWNTARPRELTEAEVRHAMRMTRAAMTRTLKAKRGNVSLRKWRRIVRGRRALCRLEGACADMWWEDLRAGTTFRGWRHPQAVGR